MVCIFKLRQVSLFNSGRHSDKTTLVNAPAIVDGRCKLVYDLHQAHRVLTQVQVLTWFSIDVPVKFVKFFLVLLS